MDEKRIREIVRKVYAKAKNNCVSEAKSALAKHVEDDVFKKHKKNISYRTVERAFDKYIDGIDKIDGKKIGPPIAESVIQLCKYLGYEDYTDYVENQKRIRWTLGIIIGIVFGALLITALSLSNYISSNGSRVSNELSDCMTWLDSTYVKVSCNSKPNTIRSNKVEPLDPIRLDNFKKVEVDAKYKFFSNADEPLIWYYKKNNKEIEYFTSPGLHPINGETLRKITPYIIETYVPIHSLNEESFLE